ncbi:MAG: hypothetical protein ACRC1K_05705 [Planctomycetia bacterium]
MNALYLLAAADWLDHCEKPEASSVVAGYLALWHPALLAHAESMPALVAPDALPEPAGGVLLLLATDLHGKLPPDAAAKLESLKQAGGRVFTVEDGDAFLDDPGRLLDALGLATGDDDLKRDFFALGYAVLGLKVLLHRMEQTASLDEWGVHDRAKAAAVAWAAADLDGVRTALRTAFESVQTARQSVYPASIHWVDLALAPPVGEFATTERVAEVLEWRGGREPRWNLILNGETLEAYAAEQPSIVEALRRQLENGGMEILGGPYDDRPWTLLPYESRMWQLTRSAEVYTDRLERDVESFGSRVGVLQADLPQILMKFNFRNALHAAFDGSKHPQFRDPKLYWTAPDGSVIEALGRTPLDASRSGHGLRTFAVLADAVKNDRSPVVALAHWLHQGAPWYDRLVRTADYAPVFGRFQTFSDFFLNTTSPSQPTRTAVDEYSTETIAAATARGVVDPVSRVVRRFARRGRYDAAAALSALAKTIGAVAEASFGELEDAVENADRTEAADFAAVDARIDAARDSALAGLAAKLLDGAPAAPGFLIVNPTPSARRVCLELPGRFAIPAEAPVRAAQVHGDKTVVVVDVPGWGYTWIARAPGDPPAGAARGVTVSGRRLKNEYVEAEIDPRTGGVRGLWDVRTSYSRIAQQLAFGEKGKAVVGKQTTTAAGPALGEITTEGKILTADGKATAATFKQRTRLWAGRPFLEINIEFELTAPLEGPPADDFLAARWAWPDEKTLLLPAVGYTMQSSFEADFEAPTLFQLRERHLTADVLTHGLPFHRRLSPRHGETLLAVKGETGRRFTLTVGIDLAHPFAATADVAYPAGVVAVEQGPPAQGKTGWLAKLNAPNVTCSRFEPFVDHASGLRLRMTETAGKAVRAELRFARTPTRARLTNARSQLIFDLHKIDDVVPVDFSPHETLQVELFFDE